MYTFNIGTYKILLLLARSVGMFNLGDLWGYQLGGVLLLAAVRLSFLTLFHFFIVVLNM